MDKKIIKTIKWLFDSFLYIWIRVVIFFGVLHLMIVFNQDYLQIFLSLGLLFWFLNDSEGFKMMLRDITQKKGDKVMSDSVQEKAEKLKRIMLCLALITTGGLLGVPILLGTLTSDIFILGSLLAMIAAAAFIGFDSLISISKGDK